MKKPVTTFLATGAYAGFSPVMPGTVGTLWGVAIAYLTSGLDPYLMAVAVLALLAAALSVSSAAIEVFGAKDPPQVVIDEICGVVVAFFLIPFSLLNAILVFLLFRFFDILKPYPVSAIERGLKGGPGVVLDDVAAGVYANVFARFVIWLLG